MRRIAGKRLTHSGLAMAVDAAEDYPDFGVHGRGGRLYGWYGIGQSLLMLPSDVVGTYIERLPAFEDYDADPTARDIFVSYTTSILICVAVQFAWVMFRCPPEIYQMSTLVRPTFVAPLRMKNIVAFILGKMDALGLTNDDMAYDPWDYQHITAFNFLPFLLVRIGKVAVGWLIS